MVCVSGALLGSSGFAGWNPVSQAASAVCLQAPVMWQVLLIDDHGILDFFAENVAGSLICLLCIEKTLGLVTGQLAMRCQTRTLRLDPH